MDRQNFYFAQTAGSQDLIDQQDHIEVADSHGIDLASLGAMPVRGLIPTPNGTTLVLPVTAGLGIAVGGPGGAISGKPRFVQLVADNTINCAVDTNGVSTIPVGAARWILVALQFARADTDPAIDGNNASILFNDRETSALVVFSGTEGGGRPIIPVECVPIADFLLAVGTVALTPAMMDRTRARPPWAKNPGGANQQLADLASSTTDNCRGYVVEPQTGVGNAMVVGVRSGRFNLSDSVVVVPGGTATLAAPTGGFHRIALVWVDTAGAVQVSYGAPIVLASPAVPPSFEGKFPVATYDVADTTVALLPASLVDARPMARAARDVPNRYKFVAGGGETAVTIGNGWTFAVGSHGLLVHKNGLLLAESAYTEAAGGTGITGLAALAMNDVVELVAPRVAGTNPVVSHVPSHGADGPDAFDFGAVGGLVVALDMASTDDTHYVVSRFAAVINGTLRQLAAPVTRDASGLGAALWAYVWAFVSSGVVQIVETATAPLPGIRIQTLAALGIGGGGTATYLGPIRITNLGKVRAFHRVGRHTEYLSDHTAVAPDGTAQNTMIVKQTGDNAAHDVSCVEFFPPHVLRGRFEAALTGGLAPDPTCIVLGKGPQPAKRTLHQIPANSGGGNIAVLQPFFADLNNLQQLNLQNSHNEVATSLYAASFDD